MSADSFAKWMKPVVLYKTQASTGAGSTTIWLAPPQTRKVILVLHLIGYHTAGANRTCQWYYKDSVYTSGKTLGENLSLATATGWSILLATLTGPNCLQLPIPITQQACIGFNWTASGAGENGYVQGIGLELPAGEVY